MLKSLHDEKGRKLYFTTVYQIGEPTPSSVYTRSPRIITAQELTIKHICLWELEGDQM